MNISHILVATDLSPEAMSCIPQAASFARLVNARITLLHVRESLQTVPHGSPLAPPLGQLDDASALDAVRAQLEDRRAAYGSDVQIDVEMVVGGDAAKEIRAWADAHQVDLIVMTTHGRTGVRRLALGSVAEAVIRQSRMPVLVLPLPKT